MAAPPLLPSIRAEYLTRWRRAQIRPERAASVDAAASQIIAGRARYEAAGAGLAPWWVVGIIHHLEGGGRWTTHLHNGDPLSARTVHVPAGRPATGTPPFTWEESARDALARFAGVSDWTLPGALWQLERYNGLSYRTRNLGPSPYLWSFTTEYVRGKFVADGVYSATAVSQQPGAAAMLRRLVDRGAVAVDLGPEPATPSTSGAGLVVASIATAAGAALVALASRLVV